MCQDSLLISTVVQHNQMVLAKCADYVVCCTVIGNYTCRYHILFGSFLLYVPSSNYGGTGKINLAWYGHNCRIVFYRASAIYELQVLSKHWFEGYIVYQVYEPFHEKNPEASKSQSVQMQRALL